MAVVLELFSVYLSFWLYPFLNVTHAQQLTHVDTIDFRSHPPLCQHYANFSSLTYPSFPFLNPLPG